MRAALDPNGADAYWAGRFGLIPLTTRSHIGKMSSQPRPWPQLAYILFKRRKNLQRVLFGFFLDGAR